MRRIVLSLAVLASACAPPIESAGLGQGEQAQVIGAPHELTATDALAAYVAQPDDAFAYQPIAQISVPGGTGYILSMTSQRWRTEAEVTPTLWSHYITIVVPNLVATTTANLIIFGGSMGSPPGAGDLALPLQMATATRSIVVGVSQIPGQPLQFADLPAPVHEDALVAYSWDKAMETGDPTWAAYLPMTKAVVRAMDATQSFCAQALGRTVPDFLVTGFSKRGATTWLVGAVDPRVRGIVPGVFDILDMGPQLDHRDFRYATVGSAWTASALSPDADGKLRAPLTAPAAAYRAAFIEVVFPGAFGVPLKLSTPAYISPDNEPFAMPAPTPDPLSGNAWWHDVHEVSEGHDSQYSAAEYEGFLPFFVFGNRVADMDTLEHALHPGDGVAGAATQACTAVRLDIASGRLGWYSQGHHAVVWEEYEQAEQAMLDGDAHKAFEICRELSQQPHHHHHRAQGRTGSVSRSRASS